MRGKVLRAVEPLAEAEAGGLGTRVMTYLQRIMGKLVSVLQAAQTKLGFTGYGFTVNYPWGLGITINW